MQSTAVKFEESKQTYEGEDTVKEKWKMKTETGAWGWGWEWEGGREGMGVLEVGVGGNKPPTKEGPRSKYRSNWS